MVTDLVHKEVLSFENHIITWPRSGPGSESGKHTGTNWPEAPASRVAENSGVEQEIHKESVAKKQHNGLGQPPAYFSSGVTMNKGGPGGLEFVIGHGLKGWLPGEFERIANHPGVMVIDTRRPDDFRGAFIPNSISIGIDGNFAAWLRTLIRDFRRQILIVADWGKEKEVITRMARAGFDQCLGYLEGGISRWITSGKQIDGIRAISATGLQNTAQGVSVIDVRETEEYESEHLLGAINLPLEQVDSKMKFIDPAKQYYVYCVNGYKSIMFCSILKSRGYKNITDVKGGFKAIRELRGLRKINSLKRAILL